MKVVSQCGWQRRPRRIKRCDSLGYQRMGCRNSRIALLSIFSGVIFFCKSHCLQPTNERESEDATACISERDGPQLPQVSETAKRERRFFSEYAATYKSKAEILT